MLAGISTSCLYPLDTEKALKLISLPEVQAVEIFFNAHQEIHPTRLREMRQIADANGVRILSLHPYTSAYEPLMFFSRYERRFQESAELYKKYYEAANMLGAKLIVFHGGAKNAKISCEEYFECFGRLVNDAILAGSSLCHENVSRCKSHSPEFFRRLSKAIPKARFVFDIKQAIRAGEDVFEFAKAMSGKISHVHFSDHDLQNDCLAPGKGTFNSMDFLYFIRKSGFNGGVIVELYRENFGDIVELFAGYQHLLTQISTVLKNDETIDSIRQTL